MDTLMTADDLAPILRMTRQAIYRFAREGALPHIRIGERKIRFSRAEIERFLAARAAQSTSAQRPDTSVTATV